MSDIPTITQQYSFTVGDDGETDGIEPSEESVENSLETFGASVDHRERDTQIDQPEATTFGVDDRKTVTRGNGSEQHALFADTEDDQRTLTGERAASQCLFESDEQDADREHDHTEEADAESDKPTEATDVASPRAVVTDGGRVEDEHDTTNDDTDTEDHDDDPTFDPDAEIVTTAWEGVFLSASWGYDQTNVELAQIVEVSDSGKTVLARKIGAERVEHAEGSEYLRPTAEQYGDEFRLHVRNGIKDDPRFRGSYPLGNDGNMDGPTRRGSFYPFDNDPEATVRQTDPYHRH